MTVLIRAARPDDAAGIAAVNRRSWDAAYRGMVDDAVLDGLDASDLEGDWRAAIERPRAGARLVVAEDAGGEVVGYCRYGPGKDRDVDPTLAGEVYGLYVAPDRWGAGVGSELLRAAFGDLARLGRREVRLEVVEANARARAFYERIGFEADGPGGPFYGAPQLRLRMDLPAPRHPHAHG
jgi:ribosomal protein S18 acetylase RimI-like enzyme